MIFKNGAKKEWLLGFQNIKNFVISSTFLFVINGLISLFNFAIVVYISKFNLADWNVIVGVNTIFLTIVGGYATYFSRKISKLAEQNDSQKLANFYKIYLLNFFQKNIIKLTFLILSLILLIKFLFNNQALDLINIVLLNLFLLCEVYFSIYKYFEYGVANNKKSALLTFLNGFLRVLFTVIFLALGAGVYSLLLGFLMGSLIPLVMQIVEKKDALFVDKKTENLIKKDLFSDFKNANSTTFLMVFGAFIFNFLPAFLEKILTPFENSIFAALYSVIQIIHFIMVSGLTFFIVYATKKNSFKIYLTTLFFASFSTIFFALIFFIFKTNIFQILHRQIPSNFSQIFILSSFFVLFYNIHYINIQYFIAKNVYKMSVFAIISSVFFFLLLYIFSNILPNFALVKLLFSMNILMFLIAIFSTIFIIKNKDNI